MKLFNKSALLASLVLFSVLFSACSNPLTRSNTSAPLEESYMDYDSAKSAPTSFLAEGEYGFDDVATESVDVEAKVIKSGSLDLHVDDVRESVDLIEASISEWGGSVLYLNVSRGDSSYYADIQIRVPAEGFDSAMGNLKDLAIYTDNEWTNADDVTDAYMDLTARVNNAYVEEQAYLNLMDRAGTVTEILEVTRSLSTVRSNIEYMESQLSYYDTRVAFSTIDLYLTEDESVSAVTEKWRPFSTVTDAFGNWLVFLQDVLDGVIYLAIFGWPFAILGWFGWKWLDRKKKKGKK
ncbi:MAG: hypothetical protein ACI9QC_000033 [Oceanicoccus sp.]|jgi:hypothetical protein